MRVKALTKNFLRKEHLKKLRVITQSEGKGITF